VKAKLYTSISSLANSFLNGIRVNSVLVEEISAIVIYLWNDLSAALERSFLGEQPVSQ